MLMYGAGLPTVSTTSRTSTPMMNATQRVEASARGDPPSAQTATARLQNVAAPDKKLLQKKKSAKAVQRDSSGDSLKTQRQANETARESGVTRPNRDVSTNVSKQHNDYNVDIRTPSQPPQPRLPVSDLRQPNTAFDGRLSESSSLYCDHQSSNDIRAEEFLRVSN